MHVQPGGVVLAVVGASGGVGASVLAAGVAVRARRAGVEAVLVDGCPLAGGLDVTLGAEHESGIRWPDLGRLSGHADGRALICRLPAVEGVPVLSFDRTEAHPPADVATAVLGALAAECELVVVDVGLLTGSVAESALDAAAQVVLVAGGDIRQVAALSVVTAHVRGRRATSVMPEIAVCLRGPARGVGPVASVISRELGLPAPFALGDDQTVRGDLVHGIAPGTRGGGPVVAAADAVLGWAVLPRRDAA